MARDDVARVDFYFDDWLTGTMELSAELRGAYITVCALIWKTGNRLKDNETVLARWCGMSVRKWRAMRQALMEAGKLEVIDGYIRQQRAEAELEAARERREKARENGAKGGQKRAENEANRRKSNGPGPSGPSSYQHRHRSQEEGDSPPSAPPMPPPAEPTSARPPEKPPRASRRQEGTRLPEGWRPTQDGIAFAEDVGLSHDDVAWETGKFSDHYRGATGQRGRSADWAATWRKWCRRVADDRRRLAPRAGPAAQNGSRHRGDGRQAGYVALGLEVVRRRREMAGQVPC